MNAANRNTNEVVPNNNAEALRLTIMAAAGDQGAQRRLVLRLMPQVRRTMSYMTKETELAEDLAQTALIRILHRADSYRGESSLEFWASRISSRIALNEMKKLKRQRALKKYIPEPRSPFPLTDDAASGLRTRRKLADMLSEISKKHRLVLILKHVEGYSVKEIATQVGAPPNTVRERLRIARKKLRLKVGREPELKKWILGREG